MESLISINDFEVPEIEAPMVDYDLLSKLDLVNPSELINNENIVATPYNSNENNVPSDITGIETNHIKVLNLTNTDIKFHILYINDNQNLSLDSRYFSPGYTRQMFYPKTTRYVHIVIKGLLKDNREYPIDFGKVELLKDYYYEISGAPGNFTVKKEEDII